MHMIRTNLKENRIVELVEKLKTFSSVGLFDVSTELMTDMSGLLRITRLNLGWRVPCQWETSLQSNAVSHWLGLGLYHEQHAIMLILYKWIITLQWRYTGVTESQITGNSIAYSTENIKENIQIRVIGPLHIETGGFPSQKETCG